MSAPVRLSHNDDPRWDAELAQIASLTADAQGDVAKSLAVGRALGPSVPPPGNGSALRLWELLATVASVDLTVARTIEPHLDALSILRESGERSVPATSTWGVFAAEGAGMRVEAIEDGSRWLLNGAKPWCSLAGHLDRALITAHTNGGNRRLFAINLRDPGIGIGSGGWVARGLAAVTSESITLDGAIADPVGDDDWYLSRPGFAWGGIGVAAIWYGAAVAIGRRLYSTLIDKDPDQLELMILGDVDLELHGCRIALAAAGRDVDGEPGHPAITAQRARSTVSRSAERVLALAGHALGPGPLALDEDHARRVADLGLYIRQDHAEHDLARLGSKLVEAGDEPW